MNGPESTSGSETLFSDLLALSGDGPPRLLNGVHPFPDLLSLEPEELLKKFKVSQQKDFSELIDQLENSGNPLNQFLGKLKGIAEQEQENRFDELDLFRPGALRELFLELHDHVMDHPVWLHPFFLRIFEGDFNQPQLELFAKQYFNQIKNTRQCVALALGRFSSLISLPYGCLNERISELAQIVLAQLLADEYGVATHTIEDYPDMYGVLNSTTHIGMYRYLFDGLGIPFEQQDVAMLPGVADNVLTQRLLSDHPAFSEVESLASVGLGMEWGVPEFFSLLLGGMIRWAWQNDVELTQKHLIVLIAHVQYDVLHAISVMLITSFFNYENDAVTQIKQATNTLMSSRYGMMSDLYRYIFEEACPNIDEIGLESRYQLRDRRIADALLEARKKIAPERVVDGEAYQRSTHLPFVFSD
jgi:pyrroloquinoline quinone (PQQ) biosynthesis protein C